MANTFDTYNRYEGMSRRFDDLGHTTPEVELSESVRPWGKWLPAPYLPVTRDDVHKKANIVLSVGHPVGLDAQGAIIPAGIPGGHVFEYTALDYATNRVASKRADTGAAVTSAVTEATMASGLTNDVTGEFVRPVGIAAYNFYQFEGGVTITTWPTYSLTYDNPANYQAHNTMAQDLVAITCDYQILVPYVEGRNLLGPNVKVFDNTADGVDELSFSAKSYVFANEEIVPDFTNAASTLVMGSGTSIVYFSAACGLGDTGLSGLAAISGATMAAVTFTAPGDTVGSAVNVRATGYHIVYSNDTAKYVVIRTNPSDATTDSEVGLGFSGGNIVFATGGALKPGDMVVAREGKYVKYADTRHQIDEIIGQVLGVDSSPVDKSYLNRVKTAYERAQVAAEQMPGHATRGVPYSLQLITDGAWRQYSTRKKLDGTAILAAGLTTPALRLVQINVMK